MHTAPYLLPLVLSALSCTFYPDTTLTTVPHRFELFANSQLHIDMDDNWEGISHYRVAFKPFDALTRDPAADAAVRSWPKPLTIEFLEEQYNHWREDLTAVCWDAREVRELGGGGAAAGGLGGGTQQAGQGALGHGDGEEGEEGLDEGL